MDAERTPAASLAVLGLTTTTGTPPLIVQAEVLHLKAEQEPYRLGS